MCVELTNRRISLSVWIWTLPEFLSFQRLNHRQLQINWLKSKRRSQFLFWKSFLMPSFYFTKSKSLNLFNHTTKITNLMLPNFKSILSRYFVGNKFFLSYLEPNKNKTLLKQNSSSKMCKSKFINVNFHLISYDDTGLLTVVFDSRIYSAAQIKLIKLVCSQPNQVFMSFKYWIRLKIEFLFPPNKLYTNNRNAYTHWICSDFYFL